MSEMFERATAVAERYLRAAVDTHPLAEPTGDQEFDDSYSVAQQARVIVKRVIEAMREPTEAMIQAGAEESRSMTYSDHMRGTVSEDDLVLANNVFVAMIDAAPPE